MDRLQPVDRRVGRGDHRAARYTRRGRAVVTRRAGAPPSTASAWTCGVDRARRARSIAAASPARYRSGWNCAWSREAQARPGSAPSAGVARGARRGSIPRRAAASSSRSSTAGDSPGGRRGSPAPARSRSRCARRARSPRSRRSRRYGSRRRAGRRPRRGSARSPGTGRPSRGESAPSSARSPRRRSGPSSSTTTDFPAREQVGRAQSRDAGADHAHVDFPRPGQRRPGGIVSVAIQSETLAGRGSEREVDAGDVTAWPGPAGALGFARGRRFGLRMTSQRSASALPAVTGPVSTRIPDVRRVVRAAAGSPFR